MIVKDIPQKQQKQSFLLHVTVKTPASRGCSCGSVSQVLQDDGAMMQDLVFPESMRLQKNMHHAPLRKGEYWMLCTHILPHFSMTYT